MKQFLSKVNTFEIVCIRLKQRSRRNRIQFYFPFSMRQFSFILFYLQFALFYLRVVTLCFDVLLFCCVQTHFDHFTHHHHHRLCFIFTFSSCFTHSFVLLFSFQITIFLTALTPTHVLTTYWFCCFFCYVCMQFFLSFSLFVPFFQNYKMILIEI